jgi:RNAse (barnase) inhibitor barstar
VSAAEKEARALGHFVARVDGRAAHDKASLLAAVAAALRFPAYFGGNLDALADCLRDLEQFVPAPGYLLLIEHAAAACPGRRGDLAAVLAVLEAAARERGASGAAKPLRVAVSD